MAYQTEMCKTSTKATTKLHKKNDSAVIAKQEMNDENEKLRLRNAYSTLLEEYLDALGYKHWGMSLEQKMEKYSVEAWETMKRWACMNKLVLEPSEELSGRELRAFEKYVEELLRQPGKPSRKGSSMFVELLDTIDVNVEYFYKRGVKRK
ncbi:MAG: hypothetical protein J6C46_05335 [Clostridia bacterium]|nr:hypothetical protein [Clostridia bacterium]